MNPKVFANLVQEAREQNSISTAESIGKRYARCCGKSVTQLVGRLLFDCQAKSREVICRLSVIIKNEQSSLYKQLQVIKHGSTY